MDQCNALKTAQDSHYCLMCPQQLQSNLSIPDTLGPAKLSLLPSPAWAEGTVLSVVCVCVSVCLSVCYHKIAVNFNYLEI